PSASPGEGAARATYGSTRLAAMLSQSCAALSPNSGTALSHSGGGGSLKFCMAVAQPRILSKFSVIVVMASQNGMIKTSSSARVITATANPRRFHSRCWTRSISGQVATTSVVAQMIAGTNGRNIQTHAAIQTGTKRTAKVVRVRSPRTSILFGGVAGEPIGGFTCASSSAGGETVGIAGIDAVVLARPTGACGLDHLFRPAAVVVS